MHSCGCEKQLFKLPFIWKNSYDYYGDCKPTCAPSCVSCLYILSVGVILVNGIIALSTYYCKEFKMEKYFTCT